jgi:transposase-like protein
MAEAKRPRRGYRQYTAQDRRDAIALYALHRNAEYVSGQTGVPQTTLKRWLASDEGAQMLDEIGRKNRDHLDERITSILDQALDVIEQQVQRYAAGEGPRDLREIGTVYGILFDKRALQRGEATSNVGQSVALRNVTDTDVQALLEKLRQDE